MRKLLLAFSPLFLLGCVVEASGPPAKVENSNAVPVTIVGALNRQDGSPVAGMSVSLHIQQLTEDSGGWFSPCVPAQDPLGCNPDRVAETTTDGIFTFNLTGQEVQGSNGLTRALDLQAFLQDVDHGASQLHASFYAVRNVSIPTVRMWQPELTTRSEDSRIIFRFSAVEAPHGAAPAIAHADFWHGNGVAWSADLHPGDSVVDKAFEDATLRVDLKASTSLQVNNTTMTLQYWPSGVANLTGSAGAPASRGGGCNLPGAHGGCALTDGDLGSDAMQGLAPKSVTVDLGSIQRVRTVVLHNAHPGGTLAGSLDGRVWLPLAPFQTQSGNAVLDLRLPVWARYVQLRSTEPMTTLNELSVW